MAFLKFVIVELELKKIDCWCSDLLYIWLNYSFMDCDTSCLLAYSSIPDTYKRQTVIWDR